MSIFYPKIRLAWLPAMVGYAVLGSLLAGAYGILHDQVTYSISPEYFTRLKFTQFHYVNFGLPARVFVAEIGFLATWWVGFIAAWFIARITVPAFAPAQAFRHSLRGFLIVLAFAISTSIAGYVLGILHGPDYETWEDLTATLGVQDLPSFVRVAYIHNASYLGGLLGLVLAVIHLRKLRNPNPAAARLSGRRQAAASAMKLFVLLIVGVALVGCKPRSQRTVDQFTFLEPWMSVNEITNRVGQPDHGYRGQYRLRYDLADGTEMVIAAQYVEEYAPDAQRVYWFGQSRDGKWLWTKQTAGDLTHYLQWTQGTPVRVYLFRGEMASGTLVNVSPDRIQVRDVGTNTVSHDKDSILWVERNTR